MTSDVHDMQYDFWSRKVDRFIQMFEYGKDTPDQFIYNMMLMGFQESDINKVFEEDEYE